MLGTASDQGLVQIGAIGQGLPDAGIHDAQPAKVNPTWAAQPMLAAHRLAQLPETRDLMGEVFRDTRFPHQPTRQTLTDTIRLLAMSGNVTTDQARWLADNKSYPNRLWSAIGYLSTGAANDDDSQILRGLQSRITELAPLREVSGFVTAWAKHLPNLIEPRLIQELHTLMRLQRNPELAISADWEAFNHALESTVVSIAGELNKRMTAKMTFQEQPLELALCFASNVRTEGALVFGADFSIGLELAVSISTTTTPYWDAVVTALTMIQRHLFPISTARDLMELCGMMAEEADEDLQDIEGYLKAHDLEPTPDNVEEAIGETAGFIVDCYDAYEHFHEDRAMRQQVEEVWKLTHTLTAANFIEMVAKLPAPITEDDKSLAEWLKNTAAEMEAFRDRDSWYHELEPLMADGNDGCLQMLDERTPVYCEDDELAVRYANDLHESFMQGDDSPLTLTWGADPQTILDWTDNLRTGHRLLGELIKIGNENRE